MLAVLSINHIQLDSLAYNDIPTIWIAINVYLSFIQAKNWINKLYSKHIEWISKQTFGVYIVHMIFINFLYKALKFNPYEFLTAVMVTWLGVALLIFVCSILLTYCINKIPYINIIWKL